MVSIFAFDLDGTLFTEANLIHPETLLALKKSKEKGHYNVISTGRALENIINSLGLHIELFDYLIGSNGSVIYDVINKKTTVIGKIDTVVFDLLFATALEQGLIMRIDTFKESVSFYNQSQVPDWLKEQNAMDISQVNFVNAEEIKQFAVEQSNNIVQMALRGPLKIMENQANLIREKIGNFYEVKLTNSIYIDVNAKNINKWSGIEYILRPGLINAQNIYAFGDSGNDVEMLKNASIGIAMGNASDDAKQAADIVIGENTSNSIATMMYSLI
ncbi:HAD-IIB family hydrolase [Mycoplasmopsis californica]|nr:HAD-IIB family hydrolase [Mycoplasmopsis californica]